MEIRIRVSKRFAAWASFAAALFVVSSCLELKAQTFQTVCPSSASLFTTSPPGRILDKPWKKDYPILIYNMDGVRADLDAVQAAQIAKSKSSDATAAQVKIDAEQAQFSSLPEGDEKIKLQADIKSKQATQVQLNAAAADAKAAQEQKEGAKSKSTWIGKLFWKEAGNDDTLSPINNPGFIAKVYTTEKVLVLSATQISATALRCDL